MRLPIGTRLGMGYGVVFAAMLAVFVLSVGAFEVSRSQTAAIRQTLYPSITAANRMLFALEQMENAEFLYFIQGEDPQRHARTFDSEEGTFNQALISAESLAATPGELAAIASASQHLGAFVHIDQRIRGLLTAGDREAARRLNLTESMQVADQLRSALRTYRELNLDAILERHEQENRILRIAEWLAGSVALLGALLALTIWRRNVLAIVAPLQTLKTAATSIAEGRFVQVAHPQAERTVELDALQRDFNAMARQLESMTRGLEAQVSERTHELQSAKDQLEALVAELRGLDKMKSDLMAVVSHELLTPINFIMAYGSTLEEEVLGPLNPDQVQAVRRIVEGSQRLTRMVRNVLDYTRLESGRLSIRSENLDYSALVSEVVESLRPTAEAKSQSLEAIVPADLASVWADPSRVGQILKELLDNALKFTSERGRIRVRVTQDAETVRTEVTDTGVGMPESVRANLFRGFYQADATSTRAFGGLGLGLAIVHHLVTRMGGTITADSTPGEGSTFCFTLPRADRQES